LSIILDTPLLRTKEITKSKLGEPKTSSILLISAAIIMAIILLTYAGMSYTEHMKEHTTCRDKIIGFEQRGMYPSPGEFKLALSFCDSK
jgi:hypothetical protein